MVKMLLAKEIRRGVGQRALNGCLFGEGQSRSKTEDAGHTQERVGLLHILTPGLQPPVPLRVLKSRTKGDSQPSEIALQRINSVSLRNDSSQKRTFVSAFFN